MDKRDWTDHIEGSDQYNDRNVKTLENFLKDLDGAIHPLEDFKKSKRNKRNKRKFRSKT